MTVSVTRYSGSLALTLAKARVAYEFRDDLLLYISCQEAAHGRFSCEDVRRATFELLVEREEVLSRSELCRAIMDTSWCPRDHLVGGHDCDSPAPSGDSR